MEGRAVRECSWQVGRSVQRSCRQVVESKSATGASGRAARGEGLASLIGTSVYSRSSCICSCIFMPNSVNTPWIVATYMSDLEASYDGERKVCCDYVAHPVFDEN